MTGITIVPFVSSKKVCEFRVWVVLTCRVDVFPRGERIRKPHSRGDVLIFIIHLVYRRLNLFVGSCLQTLPIASCAVLDC